MKRSAAIFLVIAVVALLVLSMSVYTIDQRKAAIKFQLGEVVSMQTTPGLYFMVPVLQNVRLYDTRIQTYDSKDAERFLTTENKNVLVDSFVKWRVIDVRQYYVSVRGDPAAAEARISQTVNDALRAEFAKRTVHDVVSGEREKIMETVADKVDKDVKGIGVEVVDVRLKRVDLVPEISSDVFRRMESERKRVANELRSTGSAEGEKIKADADRQKQVIVAEAYRDAQRIKGEGDAQAARIYAEAYGRNAEFYSFYRSLEAYRAALRTKGDVMVLEPTSDFFKYLKNPGRGK
jgi:membrane protease subunit HflC